MNGAEVVVVGGGVTGLSAAWWLARSGVRVLVLDKGIVGWEASGRNGGGASHYHSPLFHEEQRLWPQMDELLGYSTEYRRERVIVALTEAQLAHYRYMASMHRALGYPVDDLDAQDVRKAVPLAGDNALGGIHVHFGGHANPQRTVQAYAWALQDLGGRILQHTPATQIRVEGGRAVEVLTPRGSFGCDSLVVAAGPQSGMLLAPLGIDLPLAPARAEMIITEPAPLMAIGGVDGNGLYGRQTLRGNLAYGGGPHEWIEVDETGPKARPSTPAAAQPVAPGGRAAAQGRQPAGDPQLGRGGREHAGRPPGDRAAGLARQRHRRHHVGRRLRPVAGHAARRSGTWSWTARAASPTSASSASPASPACRRTGGANAAGRPGRCSPRPRGWSPSEPRSGLRRSN